jgi:pentatricopeptide repeat protein
MLVDVYAKCGAFGDATAVIGQLPEQGTAVSWNSLISGYVEHGLGEEGLECLEKMQRRGLSPNSVTFICSLGACGISRSLENVQGMHTEIIKAGLDTVQSINNTLIDAYAKCGSILNAQHVFDKSASRCIMSWTAIIAGYVENGFDQDVRGLLSQMQLEGLVLDAATYVIVLKALGDAGILSSFQDIYDTILKKGLDGNIFLGNTLMDLYAKSGQLTEAKAIFDGAKSRSLVSWNTLIAGYAENGLGEEALECFQHMQLGNTLPDAMTCIASLKACGCIKHSTEGQEMHSLITKIGLDLALTVGNSLVDMYLKCGLLAEARCVFHLLPTLSTVSWNTIIAGLFEHGLGEEASKCMEAMKHDRVPWDATTFVYSLQICKKNVDVDDGRTRRLHVEAVTRGLEGHLFIGSALVDVYATCGRLAEARKVFDLLLNRNVVTWTALAAGYAEHGFTTEALGCLDDMRSDGLLPNAITYACGLKACSNIAALNRGQEVHSQITKIGFPYGYCQDDDEDRIVLTHALMDMYGKCGAMEDAGKVFDGMPHANAVSWNTLLTGYARCGECESVLCCIDQATSRGRTAPDGVMFVAALSVSSHGGQISVRDRCFEALEGWGIAPTLEHCNCAIDLFARAGQLDEALAMLETMPYQPNLVTWSTLLGACQNWGDVDLARLAFARVASLDEGNAAAFIIMHNMYAEAEA